MLPRTPPPTTPRGPRLTAGPGGPAGPSFPFKPGPPCEPEIGDNRHEMEEGDLTGPELRRHVGGMGAGPWAWGDAGVPGSVGPRDRHRGQGHTHSSAREASLSRKAPQTSRTILPWSPRGSGVTLKGNEADEPLPGPQVGQRDLCPVRSPTSCPLRHPNPVLPSAPSRALC